MNRKELEQTTDNIVVTIKKRKPNGRFGKSFSMTGSDLLRYMVLGIFASSTVKWHDRVFRTKRYIQSIRSEGYQDGYLTASADLGELLISQTEDSK